MIAYSRANTQRHTQKQSDANAILRMGAYLHESKMDEENNTDKKMNHLYAGGAFVVAGRRSDESANRV